jgi:hypothetical protein
MYFVRGVADFSTFIMEYVLWCCFVNQLVQFISVFLVHFSVQLLHWPLVLFLVTAHGCISSRGAGSLYNKEYR